MKNKKFWALFFSMMPGAGHMYLGLSKKGLQLMALFFIAIGLTDVLHFSMVAGLIPIIWFYSIFDVRKCYELNVQPNDDEDIKIPWSGKETKLLGYIFIFMGAISIVNEIVFPMLDVVFGWRTIHSIKTGIAAVVFILIGLKLIVGKKVITDPNRLLKSPSKRGETN